MADDCIFCSIVAGDAPATNVDEDEHTIAFMDIHPWTHGHALVIPREHTKNLYEIAEDELAPLMTGGQAAGGARCATSSAPTASTCSTRPSARPGRRSSTSTCT